MIDFNGLCFYRPKAVREKYYSIPSLFALLTSNPPNPSYPATFLLTYRMFTNAHEVLDALIDEHRTGLNGRTAYRMVGRNGMI